MHCIGPFVFLREIKKSKIKAIAEAVRSVIVKLNTAIRKLRGTYEYGKALQYIKDAKVVHQALVKAYHEVDKGVDSSMRNDIMESRSSRKNKKDYWTPDLSKTDLKVLNRKIRHDIKTSENEVTDNANWLFTSINGKNVFAIYSTIDVDNPTLLYESKEKKAETERDILLDILEEEENGESINGKPSFTQRVFEGSWMQNVNNSQNNLGNLGSGQNNRNVGVLQRESQRNGSRAFWNVLENLFEIQGELDYTVDTGEAKTSIPARAVKFSFAGPRAETADMSALEKAESMEQGKATAEEILRETGWYRGIDGKWRFEISDADAEFSRRGDLAFKKDHPDYARYRELLKVQEKYMLGLPGGRELTAEEQAEYNRLQEIWKHAFRENGKVSADAGVQDRLESYFNHDKLYEAYPELRNVRIVFDENMDENESGSFDGERIKLNAKSSAEQQKRTLIHEIQHWIQRKEGFAGGSSSEYWEHNNQQINATRNDRIYQLKESIQEMKALAEPLYKKIGYDEYIDKLMAEDISEEEMDEREEAYIKEKSPALYSLRKGINDAYSELSMLREELKHPSDLYRNTAGEIEARDASARMGMSEAERRESMPNRGDENTVFADDIMISFDEENKKTAEEAVEGEIFFPDENDVKVFSEQVDDWLRGNMPTNGMFELGKTPEVLKKLGVKDLPMVMSQEVIAKVTGGKHDIAIDDIKKLPSIVANPIMVFKSATIDNAFVLLTEIIYNTGNDVIVAMQLNRSEKHVRVNRVASLYGKKNIETFVISQINAGNLKYIDKNKSLSWSQSRGLQLPKLADTTRGSNNSILTKEDIVNRYYEQNNEIKFSMPAPRSQAQYEDRAYKLERDIRTVIEEKLGNTLSDDSLQAVQGLADSVAKGDEAKAKAWREVLRDSILKNDMVYYGEADASDDVLSQYFKSMRKRGSRVLVEKEDSQDLTTRELSGIFGVGGWSRTAGIGVDVVYEELVNMGALLNDADSVQDRLIAIKEARDAIRSKEKTPMLTKGNVTELIDRAERGAVGAVSEVERARGVYNNPSTAEAVPLPLGKGGTVEPVSQANVAATMGSKRTDAMHRSFCSYNKFFFKRNFPVPFETVVMGSSGIVTLMPVAFEMSLSKP